MNTINNNTINEIVIKKSKFIAHTFYINNENEVLDILNHIKNTYKDATHYCYSYIINNKQKAFDDGEPNNTAGLPILEVLKKNNLTNLLVIVVRYFGGIKLGSGGLIRAYSKSVREVLKKSEIILYKEYINVTLRTNYNNQKLIDGITSDLIIVNKSYDDEIVYTVKVDKNDYECFINKLNNTNINYK